MTLELGPELEAALVALAQQRGVSPEAFVTDLLRNQLVPALPEPVLPDSPERVIDLEPRNEWERRVLDIPVVSNVSLPDWALRREAMYD